MLTPGQQTSDEMESINESTVRLVAASVVTTAAIMYMAAPSAGPSAASRQSLKNKLEKVKRGGGGAGQDAEDAERKNGVLDIRRKFQIAKGGATDHAGEVVVVALPGFDLNRTIFGSVEGALPRTVIKSKIGVELFWSDLAIQRANAAYKLVPPPPSYKSSIVKFMFEECNLSMEHADGSFMDHLRFCHDYSAQHFKGHSPVPLFLHSIMGVGTNFFPMDKSKIPLLKGLVTPDEYTQIEAFPSVLRLLTGTPILEELSANASRLGSLKEVRMHRVIDNAPLTLGASAFVTNLNYHVMHLLDFLPTASWLSQLDDGLFATFVKLHAFLEASGKLEANVDFDLKSGESTPDGVPVTLGSLIRRVLPMAVKLNLNVKAIKNFSKKIGHDLHYELVWN